MFIVMSKKAFSFNVEREQLQTISFVNKQVEKRQNSIKLTNRSP